MVFKKVFPFKGDPSGKFKPNFEGPYVVTRVLLGEAIYISRIDGDSPHEFVNSKEVPIIVLLSEMKTGHFLSVSTCILSFTNALEA